jgi:hypothetical protein
LRVLFLSEAPEEVIAEGVAVSMEGSVGVVVTAVGVVVGGVGVGVCSEGCDSGDFVFGTVGVVTGDEVAGSDCTDGRGGEDGEVCRGDN